MRNLLYLTLGLVFMTLSFTMIQSFKSAQKNYSRVTDAYKDKEQVVTQLLNEIDVQSDQLRLYIRAFKKEQIVEIWAKNDVDKKFQLLKEYDICKSSGSLGPKRKQGDLQVPEGFYHIDRFNPVSNYHLSLGINYPNKSDKILGNKNKLGGDIFIHGDCVTIGCMPMTDDKIKEIYILCVEAKNNGQETIPVNVFPTKMTNENLELLHDQFPNEEDNLALWNELKDGYDFFNNNKTLPNISFLESGRHRVSE